MLCEEVDNIGRRGGARRTNADQLADLGCKSIRSVAITSTKTVTSRRPIAASQIYHSVSRSQQVQVHRIRHQTRMSGCTQFISCEGW